MNRETVQCCCFLLGMRSSPLVIYAKLLVNETSFKHPATDVVEIILLVYWELVSYPIELKERREKTNQKCGVLLHGAPAHLLTPQWSQWLGPTVAPVQIPLDLWLPTPIIKRGVVVWTAASDIGAAPFLFICKAGEGWEAGRLIKAGRGFQ